jgi:prepilin-type N-terminal cleavage/methylation domain-containing protein
MMTRKTLKNRSGVTMIELLIVMTIVVFVLAATSRVLTALVTQFKQQSKIVETNVEEVMGYEMLRRDIQSAGYGLATALSDGTNFDITTWDIANITGYVEVNSPDPEAVFDDHLISSPPRALIATVTPGTIVNAPFVNAVAGSDYLVIKSILVARNDEAGKFHHLDSGNNQNAWTPADANLDANDRVIVMTMRQTDPVIHLTLITNTAGGTRHFSTTKGATANYAPTEAWERRIVYGVADSSVELSAPFNRADYVIANSPALVPRHCADSTGVLLKRIMKHDGNSGGVFPGPGPDYADHALPLLDCVADMQVSYVDDTGTERDNIDGLTAADVRDDVREVRVYILTHEGQKDPNFDYPNTTVDVGRNAVGVGRVFDLTTIPDYQNYRWKLLTLAEKPMISR